MVIIKSAIKATIESGFIIGLGILMVMPNRREISLLLKFY
jgi:hypothetical protein